MTTNGDARSDLHRLNANSVTDVAWVRYVFRHLPDMTAHYRAYVREQEAAYHAWMRTREAPHE